jgi:hypothetical protein
LRARSSLETIEAFDEIIVISRMIRLFRATEVLAAGLAELWLSQGHYGGAASFIGGHWIASGSWPRSHLAGEITVNWMVR